MAYKNVSIHANKRTSTKSNLNGQYHIEIIMIWTCFAWSGEAPGMNSQLGCRYGLLKSKMQNKNGRNTCLNDTF